MSLTSSGLCMLGGASAGAAGGSVSLELQTQWSQSRGLLLIRGHLALQLKPWLVQAACPQDWRLSVSGPRPDDDGAVSLII
uniref:Uncharacterized protein n=1 Tax=Rangifer tarandus platyrhynchus TaxID=3082113 RepID=A0ACB0F4U8_RANTA|nr:unnamed protein product [Rangifer tarandus platyrhynchus]